MTSETSEAISRLEARVAALETQIASSVVADKIKSELMLEFSDFQIAIDTLTETLTQLSDEFVQYKARVDDDTLKKDVDWCR
jgi:predicted secreted protein